MQAGAESTQGGDPGSLRIGDADRDQICAVLSEHVAEGRLTIDELDQRVGILYTARTRSQAAALLADLPPLRGPGTTNHPHGGHDREDDAFPVLPDWLTDATPPAGPARSAAARVDGRTVPATPPAAPEDRAAARKRVKLRADENAIGHTFQAKRRAINAEVQRAATNGDTAEIGRLQEQLRQAHDIAASARQALAAGDRAQFQRHLARLRE